MNQFEVIKPSVLLEPYIKEYWFVTINSAREGAQRLLPTGNLMLTFNKQLSASMVSGLSKSYTEFVYSGKVNFVAVVLQPLGGLVLLGIPMIEVSNIHLPIENLGDSKIKDLEQQIFNTDDNKECVFIIENLLRKRLQIFQNNYTSRLNYAVDLICEGQGNVKKLSEATYLGYKQFKRIFSENIGLNPKEYIQIIRFQNLLYNIQTSSQESLNDLAFSNSYYDKSHLIKQFKLFTGFTPQQYLSTSEPYSEYHSLFRSTFIDVY